MDHTPGPFAVHPTNAWIVCSQLDEDGQPCPVAALAWPTNYRSEAETWANGELFAAAPAMKAALEEIAKINPADLQRKPEMALTHAFLLARKKAIDTLALLSPPSTKE